MNVIYGGSFNPPHRGHIEAVAGLLETPVFGKVPSQVIVLPSFGTPLKQVGVSFEQRMTLTRAAFAGISDRVIVSDFEEREKIQYTWQVLERLGPKLDSEREPMVFVIGTDQFEKLEHWARYPELMGLSDWIVLVRKPGKLSDFDESIRKFSAQGWMKPVKQTSNTAEFHVEIGNRRRSLALVPTKARNVSSSDVRSLLALGKKQEAKALVPEKVFELIERNHLYGT